MLAIQTLFHGPTNHRNARYSAHVMEPRPRRLTLDIDHSLSSDDNHRRVALALVERLGWTKLNGYGPWVVGDCPTGIVCVCDNKREWERLQPDPCPQCGVPLTQADLLAGVCTQCQAALPGEV